VRPTSIAFCGDGNIYLTGLKWSHWTASGAVGTGQAHQNDCIPFCAMGHYHVYPIGIELFRPRECSNGFQEYTRLSYRFVDKKPADIPALHVINVPLAVGTRCP